MLWEGLGRFVYSAVVVVAIVWLLRSGNPLGGLVLVPLLAILIRRSAESGRLRRLAHRFAPGL